MSTIKATGSFADAFIVFAIVEALLPAVLAVIAHSPTRSATALPLARSGA